jgi:type 1 glutamine amidotransferase
MKRFTRFLTITILITFPAFAQEENDVDIDTVDILFFGGGPSHPYKACADVLSGYLEDYGIYRLKYTEDPDDLLEESLADYDILLVFAIRFDHEKETSKAVREGIRSLLGAGKGLMTVHSGVACFSTWPEFADTVGIYWRWGTSTHEPYRPMMVNVAAEDHPITRGLADFKIIDEFYYRLEPREGNEMLLTSTHEVDGEEKVDPIAWTRKDGNGRVFTNVLGHDDRTWKNIAFLEIMRRGIDWAAGRL